MKKMAILIAALLLLAGCAAKTDEKPDIAAEFVRTVWEVDYATYSEDAMTAFAEEHYAEDYLEDFLKDPYKNAGVADIKSEKLVSRVLGTEHIASSAFEDVEGNTYNTESVRVFVSIDSFEPGEDMQTYFEEGQVYTLIYDVYFAEDGKIVGFDMTYDKGAAGGETLTEAERSAAGDVIREYVYTTWSVDKNYSGDDVLAFYEANLSPEFIERDGLNKELLSARESEVRAYGVTMQVTELSVSVAPHKEYAWIGTDKELCYFADAEYKVVTSGNAEYLAAVGLQQNMDIRERLYFKISGEKIVLIGAEYK